jgi:uncharacterized protein (TIGR02246 family)
MKKLLPAIPLLFATLLPFANPAAAAEALIASIQKNNDAFAKAFNAGDGAAVGQFYTADATILPPGAEMQKGRAAIAAFWQNAIKSGLKNAALTAVSVERYGSAAREIGRFSLDAPGAGGQTTKVEGKYVVIWKKIAGKWLLDTDIWNMNK